MAKHIYRQTSFINEQKQSLWLRSWFGCHSRWIKTASTWERLNRVIIMEQHIKLWDASNWRESAEDYNGASRSLSWAPILIKHTTFISLASNLPSNENSFINLQKYSVLRSLWRGKKKKKHTRQRMFCLIIWKGSTLELTDFRALFNEWRGVQAFSLHEWIDPIKEITPISC